MGGCVAGMEAARIAAIRGRKVSLYEKNHTLGGNMISGGSHSFKKEVRELNVWYQNELKELPMKIHTGEIGYNIEYGLLNSRFHGVPQNRQRSTRFQK